MDIGYTNQDGTSPETLQKGQKSVNWRLPGMSAPFCTRYHQGASRSCSRVILRNH
jgi:hypothetical protein